MSENADDRVSSDAMVPSSPPRRRRRHRVRSPQKLAQLRAQVETYRHVVLALPLVHDADEIWDGFLDNDTKRMRRLLRHLADATAEATALAHQNATLTTLLTDHHLAARTIASLLCSETEDPWDLHVQRWRALARIHFRPWTRAQTHAELNLVQRIVRRLVRDAPPRDGLTIFGWSDSVCRVGVASPQLHFRLHKTFCGFDCEHFVETTERIFTDTQLYTSIVHGGRAQTFVDVLQHVAPHTAIVMYHERYAGVPMTVHSLSLNARIDLADGTILQVYRPIDALDLMRVFVGPQDTWMTNFHWAQFTALGPKDYRVTVHGTLQGDDRTLARYWQFRVLESLVRIEMTSAQRGLLQTS